MRAVRERLRAMYGIPVMEPHGDPVGELVLTVLSQSTNDRNRDVAFLRLRERFDAWEAVRDAPGRGDRGGDQARRHLQGQVGAHQGDARGDRRSSTSPGCATRPVPESQAYLCALPGVGRKTAACVLLFSYGLRDVPVDTHVSRVGMRLHVLEPGAPFDRLHDQMLAITPPGAELELHVNLLRHGRRTCHAQRPACGECALRRMCPSRRE